MHPFINILGRDISSYGLMLLLGFAVAILVAYFHAKFTHYPAADIVYVSLIAVCGALIGLFLFRPITKLPEVLFNIDKYIAMTLTEFLSYMFGELVFYGGLIGGVVAALLFCRGFKLAFAPIAETILPAVPLGHAIGRLGCYLAGCCYGIEAGAAWGVCYPPHALSAVRDGIPRFPVQLLEAGLNVLLCAALLLYVHRRPGRGYRVIGIYLTAYAVERFALEFLRGDVVRGFVLGISTSQIVSLVLFPVGLLFLFFLRTPQTAKNE
ncbi:MAG: prolipoprotein diacylglyceryl transferase [Oscillospiraceae bacterium]|nr:prolipoprotein diacylglyceryl transferase [Oscillospiraceae bacterium]